MSKSKYILVLSIVVLIILLRTPDKPTRAAVSVKEIIHRKIDYVSEILPILSDNCFHCHGPDKKSRKKNLRLDIQEGLLKKTKKAFVIKPGDLTQSDLWARITSDDKDYQMPPSDSHLSLKPAEIKLVKAWILQGAKWKGHWAFEPIEDFKAPEVKNKAWPKNDIDFFVLKKIESAGKNISPEATRRELIRRLSVDLTGLPATIKETKDFLNDKSEKAYEKVVDRLLASPRYGERMAWPWLDASRYSDSNGFQGDPTRFNWPWRDWVVKVMNENIPFDQFTIEQLAGDLLPEATQDQILATAFNRNHTFNGEGGAIPEEVRMTNVMDRVETTGTTWLGLTMLCCRCHDHKYDPLTANNYYQMSAFFNNISENGNNKSGPVPPLMNYPLNRPKDYEAHLKELQDDIKKKEAVPIEVKTKGVKPKEKIKDEKNLKEAQIKAKKLSVKKAKDKLRAYKKKYLVSVMIMDEMKKPRKTFFLPVGAYDKPGAEVFANIPEFLGKLEDKKSYNRLDLANWIVSGKNTLTARVIVNRYWMIFFGEGLVKSQENFGTQADRPTHPQLLDYLATEFVKGKWDVKRMHKMMVMTATYRQSSKSSATQNEWDPKNKFLARGPRYRMASWMIRDQALAVSGLLVKTMGGPGVRPYQPKGLWSEPTFNKIKYKQDHGDKLYRRSLYTFWRRIVQPSTFFDVAARQTCEVRVARTNSPLHALLTMNDPTYVEASRALAQRAIKEAGATLSDRLHYIYQLLLTRTATKNEMSILTKRLDKLTSHYKKDTKAALELLSVGESKRDESLSPAEHAALSAVCLMILNLDESLSKQ